MGAYVSGSWRPFAYGTRMLLDWCISDMILAAMAADTMVALAALAISKIVNC